MQIVNGKVVPGIEWRVVVHTAGLRPFRIEHAFNRFRNRRGLPAWTAACNRDFSAAALADGDPDGRCETCRLAVSA